VNFGIAREYGSQCHLRFDDTNPAKEEMEYIDSIQEDLKWLGFDWENTCISLQAIMSRYILTPLNW